MRYHKAVVVYTDDKVSNRPEKEKAKHHLASLSIMLLRLIIVKCRPKSGCLITLIPPQHHGSMLFVLCDNLQQSNWWDGGCASIRCWTTSFMVGRKVGVLYVQRIAIRSALIIYSLNESDTRLSNNSYAPSFVSTLVETQYTMFLLSPNSASTGFFPVISSINTTP